MMKMRSFHDALLKFKCLAEYAFLCHTIALIGQLLLSCVWICRETICRGSDRRLPATPKPWLKVANGFYGH